MQRTAFHRFFARRRRHGVQDASTGDVCREPTSVHQTESVIRKITDHDRAAIERAHADMVASSGDDAIVPTPSGKFQVWRAGDTQPLGTFTREDLAQAAYRGLRRARGER